MFTDFHRIVQAQQSGSLAAEWAAIIAERMSRPWNTKSLTGHIPLNDLMAAHAALPDSFDKAGLYVWGGWRDGAARVLYVGIAHGYSLADRIAGRYFLPSTVGPNYRFRELSLASGYAQEFAALETDCSPNRPVNIDKYRLAGIPVPPQEGRHRRLWRAERYAKTGLNNVWYFPIPAPHGIEKGTLKLQRKR